MLKLGLGQVYTGKTRQMNLARENLTHTLGLYLLKMVSMFDVPILV